MTDEEYQQKLDELQEKLDEAEAAKAAAEAVTPDDPFEDMGGSESVRQVLDKLNADPKFHEYVQAQQGVTPEQQEAIKTVQTLSEKATQAMYDEKVKPLEAQLASQAIESRFDELGKKYPGWETYSKEIENMASDFPFKDPNNPTALEIESLAYMAAQKQDGAAAIEVLQNEPVGDVSAAPEIPKDLSTEQAMDLAAENLQVAW